MHPTRPTLLAALGAASLLAPTAAHAAATGPGRATYELGAEQPRPSVDPEGFFAGVTLPDGGTILAGRRADGRVPLVALKRDGTPDPAFGTGGRVDVTVPVDEAQIQVVTVNQVLRRPDGRLVLVTSGPPLGAPSGSPQLALTGLTATGAPDPAFSGGQTLETGVLDVGSAPAALTADGGIVLTGAADQTQDAPPPNPTRSEWVVRKLDATGAVDSAFGTVTLPGGGAAGGVSIGVAPGGALWALGRADGALTLRHLLASGQVDPAFAGGGAIPVTGSFDAGLLVRDDGSADVLASTSSEPTGGRLVRVRPDGTADPAFHGGAPLAVLPGGLVAGPAGSDVIVDGPLGLSLDAPARIALQRVGGDGTITLDTTAPTGLAGGQGSIFTTIRSPRPTGTDQSDTYLSPVSTRVDGSVVLAGAVAATRPVGEGGGFEHDRGAVVSLAADGTPDPAFGGADSPASLRLSVPTQHTTSITSKRVYAIKLAATTSDIGLVDLRVTANGKTVAASTAPAFAEGRQTLKAFLTRAARKSLRHHHGVRVSVRGTFVDVLGHRTTATAKGTLK